MRWKTEGLFVAVETLFKRKMRDKIIDLLPSKDLKQKIRETDFQFTEPELLTIILAYAPTYDQRLAMLDEFSRTAPPKLAKVAEYFIAHQQEVFRRFVEERDGYVYELHIRYELPFDDKIYRCTEKIICASYEAALDCIDSFYKENEDLEIKETEETEYMVVKRNVFAVGDRCIDDQNAVCFLGPSKKLLRVEESNLSVSGGRGCNNDCLKCEQICPGWSVDILYPCFAFSFSLIRYRDQDVSLDFEGKEHLGICLCAEECCKDCRADAYYVIPMDCEPVRYHRFERVHEEHDHIPLPEAELVRIEELDEETRGNYDAFAQWCRDREEAGSSV